MNRIFYCLTFCKYHYIHMVNGYYDIDFYPKNKTGALFKGYYDEYKYAHSNLSTMHYYIA